MIDSNLSWKSQVTYIAKKIKRNIGILFKLRYYVNSDILVELYYALIYPFLTYALISWINTYSSTTKESNASDDFLKISWAFDSNFQTLKYC